MTLQKTAFLDRDGVINADSPDYIKHPDEFVFLPGACEGINILCDHGWRVMVVTNQSGVARGLFDLVTLNRIHRKMIDGVAAAGGRIDDIFFCPHHPDEGCGCRKPHPGMILQARERHQIDLLRSVMFGDSAKDVQCGQNAGCGTTVLVLTGNGPQAVELLVSQNRPATHVAVDLKAAAELVVNLPG